MGKLRILVVMENVFDRGAYSGGRYHAWLVTRALSDLGHSVHVLTDKVPHYVKELPGRDHDRTINKGPVLTRSNCNISASDGPFDMVCVFPLKATPWGVRIARRLNIPAFTWVFDPYVMVSLYAPDVAGRMSFDGEYLSALRDSHRIIASTETSVQYIKAYVGNHMDVRHLYPCANSAIADNVCQQSINDGILKVIAITRATSHKRSDHVLRAFRELLRSGVHAHLYLMSGFGDSGLTRMAGRLHISHAVSVEAKCSEQRKWELLKSADIMLGASIYEGFGLWLMEGIYACLPFVVYKFPIFQEMSRGDGGWFAEYDKSDALSQALQEAAKGDLRAKKQHLTALAPMFSFESFKARVKELIEDVPRRVAKSVP